MADAARGDADRSYIWGSLSAFGLVIALIACALDQAAKFWLLDAFDLANRGVVPVTPFADLVLTWNTGISYGLFPQQGPVGQWALLAFKVAAVAFLWAWLSRASTRLTAAALGLIIGGGWATPSTGCIGRECWISCCSTSIPLPGASAGMSSTWPISPLLRGWWAYCMNRCGVAVPQKRPDLVFKTKSNGVGVVF